MEDFLSASCGGMWEYVCTHLVQIKSAFYARCSNSERVDWCQVVLQLLYCVGAVLRSASLKPSRDQKKPINVTS